MSKQMLIYDNIQPLSTEHSKWNVKVADYAFASHVNSVPVLASEMTAVAAEYPIIFSATARPDEFVPLAVMGLKDGENLLLDSNNMFITRYVPAFIRRYPFVLGGNEGEDVMALCIDADSKCFIRDGSDGLPMFTETGEQSEQLKAVLEFQRDYQYRAEVTREFSKRLNDLKLLEPMTATITVEGKNNEPVNFNVSGFYVINRDKLRELSDADALELFKKDGLELIYAHLQSLPNMNRLIDLMSEKLSA